MKIHKLVNEINKVTKNIKSKDIQTFTDTINKYQRIYVFGEGRSGLVLKSFAMRLARLGKTVYVVGETVTPPINGDDLLITVSGSGETKTVLETVKICRVMRGQVMSLTATINSSLTKLSNTVILIPAQLPKRLGNIYQLRELIGVPERPLLASIFELASLIFLEIVAFKLEKLWLKNMKKPLLPS